MYCMSVRAVRGDDYGIPILDGVAVTPVGHKGEIDCLIEGAGMK